jgi:hypothetical protein
MQTREEAPPATRPPDTAPARLFDGLGRTTLVAATALAACALLIAFAAALSMCWAVHPALFVAAGSGLGWGIARVAPRLFR